MKKRSIGFMLLLLELGVLLLLCYGFGYTTDYTLRLVFLYLMLQYLLGHYKIKTSLIWDEIHILLTSHICFYLTTLILIPVKMFSVRLAVSNLLITILMFGFDVIAARYLRILLRKDVAERVLIIGIGKEAKSLYEVCSTNRFAMMKVMGFIDTGHAQESELINNDNTKHMVYSLNEMEDVLRNNHISELVLTVPDLTKEELEKIMKTARPFVKSVKYIPRINGLVTFDSQITDFDGLLLISRSSNDKSLWKQAVKRFVDILGGIAGCILLLPLTLYVRHANHKNGDDDPIFFKQERIGKDGKPFEIYKFRTMVPHAEELLEKLMKEDHAIREEYETNKKLRNDPRITKAGQFLRAKSLDEFPQLINVLKGEMSLVGPRPYLPREKKDMKHYYDSIISSKPGITGMWQSHGRNDVGFEERCEMDDYYHHNWSLWLDVTILIKTVKSVWHHDGAL